MKSAWLGQTFFWEINQKLKQLMGSEEYFGGLSVIATGDFHQLASVNNPWIFKQTNFHGQQMQLQQIFGKHCSKCIN